MSYSLLVEGLISNKLLSVEFYENVSFHQLPSENKYIYTETDKVFVKLGNPWK